MNTDERTPLLQYSDPEDGENPRLVRFDNLNERTDYDVPFRDKDEQARHFRLVELPRTDTNERFIHLYHTLRRTVRLRYYGYTEGKPAESLGEGVQVDRALYRQPVRLPDGFDGYLLRIDLGDAGKTPFDKGDTIAVAAYAGREPASPGGITLPGAKQSQQPGRYLPFSHNGRSFQRLVISTCDPREDIRSLAKATGLETAETYFGKLGSVIAVGVPPGMSLNTGIDTTRAIRQKGNSGDGTVDEDYILNLFRPGEPTGNSDERWTTTSAAPDGVTEFRPPQARQFDCDREPLTVALIDSGIDYGRANAGHWASTRYSHGPDTDYVTPGRYGYDFIQGAEEPIDEAPHGTYVAASLLNQYTATRPLQLLHMKVFGAEGIATYFGSLVSIYEATLAGARVINLSWGFYQMEEPRALYCAIKTAADRGVFLVASAGNDTENLDKVPQWPAAFADDFPCNLISVASYHFPDPDRTDPSSIRLTDISNFGQWEVPVAAFLTSPVPRFSTGDTHFPVGTSISAPILAGQLANWLADHPGGNLAQFRKQFYRIAPSLVAHVTRGHYLPHVHAGASVGGRRSAGRAEVT